MGYKLGNLLGVGALGETYIALKDGKQFALKLIKEEAVLNVFESYKQGKTDEI